MTWALVPWKANALMPWKAEPAAATAGARRRGAEWKVAVGAPHIAGDESGSCVSECCMGASLRVMELRRRRCHPDETRSWLGVAPYRLGGREGFPRECSLKNAHQ